MTHLTLVGGGWSPEWADAVYGPFLAAAGDEPTVACVVLDEGDGLEQAGRWGAVLEARGARPVRVLVREGAVLDVGALGDADGVLVCGGLTPGYAAALAPAAEELRAWLAEGGRPYAGFSAGAAVASRRAVVGGWLDGGVPVCPEDASEDLEEVAVVDGLGLLEAAVDVHAAQWGTLPRLAAAVVRRLVPSGVALDEDTALVVDPATGSRVAGRGAAHVVTASGDGVHVHARRAR